MSPPSDGPTGDRSAIDGTTVPDETREYIESDPFCAHLGIELAELEPGFAETRLTLGDEHTNFHGTPHGGAVYALCDAAFAAACNAGEETRIALETNTSYLAAASVGETLVAVAEETHATRRTAEYQVTVRTESGGEKDTDGDDVDGGNDADGGDSGTGERIATFRGRAYRV